jgi:hypothetical protein
VSNAGGSPPPDDGGGQGSQGIPRSEHARLRSEQGRPIGQVVNDIQRASRQDVFTQPDDGRYVVRGPKGREHVIEVNGEHVTSLRRPDAAHQARVRGGAIRPATDDEFQRLKRFVP